MLRIYDCSRTAKKIMIVNSSTSVLTCIYLNCLAKSVISNYSTRAHDLVKYCMVPITLVYKF